ncbi:MAG: type 1 glutamine amidotransferase domain-containing protein [Acidimicrobiaceae bacterium]|nr:type 1 glutamine amidotransferase domain-containing protein [Acidimicrobiaceae bacterium]
MTTKVPSVLIVLTSHAAMGTTGQRTGFWLEEFAAPYYELSDAGFDIVLASPLGGQPPIDPTSDNPSNQTTATERFHADVALQSTLGRTMVLEDMAESDFDAVFFPGGHGPLWDLPDNAHSIALIESFAASKKPIAAVCHAPIALKNVHSPSGTWMIEGRNVTGFSNSEEAAAGLTDIVPELLEDMLIGRGAHYSSGPSDFAPYVVVDGLLITGQNPASSAPAARALIEMLEQRRDGVEETPAMITKGASS